jgi:hypothetical protein
MTDSYLTKDIKQIAFSLSFRQAKKKRIEYTEHLGDLHEMEPYTFKRWLDNSIDILTKTKDGVETINVAYATNVILCGPSREKYVLKNSKFEKLYEKDAKNPVWIPNQTPRNVAIYDDSLEVQFVAPWGELCILKPGDIVVEDGDNYYRIARHEFFETYEFV